MRILYSHRIQSRDGQGVHVDELVAAFRRLGHEVLVIGPSAYGQSRLGESSPTVEWLREKLPAMMFELAELAYAVHATLRLLRANRSFRPDFVYERYNLFHLAGAWLARRHGAVLYLEVNSPLAEERAEHGGLKLRRLARAIERWTWRSAHRVLPVTGVLGDLVAAAGVDPQGIMVVPNAIVPERFAAPHRPAAPNRVTLGFIGFVRPWHGLDAVIRAMAHDAVVPVSLTVVGDGPACNDLQRLAAALGIADRVRFAGVVAHDQVPALAAGFDIALQPKVTRYASPLKIFDYMAAACAIVAPDQENIREVLEHERTALLFDADAADGAWRAIRQLVFDSALRARLGEAARARALAAHTWEGNARRITATAAADISSLSRMSAVGMFNRRPLAGKD
jgi:glycosyltransferase involved in cell wall biosynthesis